MICSAISAWISTPGYCEAKAVARKSSRPAAVAPTNTIAPWTSAGSKVPFNTDCAEMNRSCWWPLECSQIRPKGSVGMVFAPIWILARPFTLPCSNRDAVLSVPAARTIMVLTPWTVRKASATRDGYNSVSPPFLGSNWKITGTRRTRPSCSRRMLKLPLPDAAFSKIGRLVTAPV